MNNRKNIGYSFRSQEVLVIQRKYAKKSIKKAGAHLPAHKKRTPAIRALMEFFFVIITSKYHLGLAPN